MHKLATIIACVVLGFVLAACEPLSPPATKPAGPSAPASAVTGTVNYRADSTLPTSAVVEVVLQDVSQADAPAETISSLRLEAQGKQVPFEYELRYDPAQIDSRHSYAVRASIKDGDKLLFTSTHHYPVITNGAPTSNVEIMVEPVAPGS